MNKKRITIYFSAVAIGALFVLFLRFLAFPFSSRSSFSHKMVSALNLSANKVSDNDQKQDQKQNEKQNQNQSVSTVSILRKDGVVVGARTLISATLADSDQERQQGLSGTKALPENSGMWFVFPTSSKQGFWMKDMKYPIDIVWISEKGTVVAITENLKPDSYPQVSYSPTPVMYVLEIAAHTAKQYGITVGTTLSFEKW